MSPIRELPGDLHTPEEAQFRETPEVGRTDRNYVPQVRPVRGANYGQTERNLP
jgi:hypothetical protein